jgi:hypothetical protein
LNDSQLPSRLVARRNQICHQMCLTGLAFSTLMMVELLGRDQLSTLSHYALIWFSWAIPMWMLAWVIQGHHDLLKYDKSTVWLNWNSRSMVMATVLVMMGTGLELFRAVGWWMIGFEIVAFIALILMVRLLDHVETNETDAGKE